MSSAACNTSCFTTFVPISSPPFFPPPPMFSCCSPPPWLLILIVKYRPRLWLPKCVLGGRGPMKTALEIERGPILFPSLLLLQTNTRRPLLPTLFSFRAASPQTDQHQTGLSIYLSRSFSSGGFSPSLARNHVCRNGSLAHELSAC